MTHQSQNPDRREEIKTSAEWCFQLLKKAGHFKKCDGTWELRQIEMAIENYSKDKDNLLQEKDNKIEELSKKERNHYANLLEYMRCIESVIGFTGPVEEVKKALQSKEERIKELSEFSKSCDELLSRIKCEFEIDTPISLSINRQLTQYNNLTTALSDYRKEEGG